MLRVFRFRLLRGGWSRPPLVILGAPALDAPPLGIGHRPTLQGHFLPGLDLTVKRLEADAVTAKLLSIAAVFSYDAAPCDVIGSAAWARGASPSYPICAVGGQCWGAKVL